MTRLDDKLVPKAKQLVVALGKTVTFRVVDRDYNPDTGITTESNVVEYQKKVTPPERYVDGYIPQDLVERGDVRIYLPAEDLEFEPQTGFEVTIDSKIWRIIYITPIYTGELIALYEFLLRT